MTRRAQQTDPATTGSLLDIEEADRRAQHSAEAQTAALDEEWKAEDGDHSSTPAERLAAVAARASVCVACGLAKTRTHVVFGEGNPEAPLMLIGEGPGAHEDATGRPFVGRAGVLLDECLRENGISRKHVYICNVVRCRACVLESGRLKNRLPTPEEARACSPWLEQTIDIVKPLVILCLGAASANVIIHKNFRMTQERGKFFETRFAHYAIAALHPAYVLRMQGEGYDAARQSLVADIASARQKVIEAKREPKTTLF